MLKLTLRQRLFCFIIIIAAAILATGFFIVVPTARKILELKNSITSIENEVEERYLNSKKLKRTLQELNEVKAQTQNLKRAFIKKGDELSLITILENIAAKHRIEQTLNVALQDKAEYYQFSFLNSGTFANHLKYLEEIEALPNYLIINDISIERRRDKSGSNNSITILFNGLVYVASSKN